MEDNEFYKKCPKCGHSLIARAKFCTQCGTSLLEYIPSLPEDEKETSHETEIIRVPEPSSPKEQASKILSHGFETFRLLKKNLASILILVGGFSIVAAIALTFISLLPKEIVSDLEIPPITGIMFDIFVAISILMFICKEIILFLGYISKKQTMDRWFSFVILLFCWINLITISLGLVQTSILYQLTIPIETIFLFLSTLGVSIGIFYFIRFKEPLFSGIFIILILSSLYLVQWITPLDPLYYTGFIFIITISIILISLITKDLIPFIGCTFLIPLMFLSPYLLSNSNVILILILLITFPFIETILSLKIIKDDNKKQRVIKTLGEAFSTLGMVTITFSVFYGYVTIELSFFLFMIPPIGLITSKIINIHFRRIPIKDWSITANLIFSVVFFDIITTETFVLYGIAALLVIYSSWTFYENSDRALRNVNQYSTALLLASLVVISISQIDFSLKISLLIIPSLFLLYLILRGKRIEPIIVQGITFGTMILITLSFIRNPFLKWQIIPLFTFIALISIIILFFFSKDCSLIKYSFNITLFTLIFELTLIIVMLWSQTYEEMLYPSFILVILMVIVSIIQTQRKLSINYLWVNATYLPCFGIMTFWNEYEAISTVLISTILTLPLILEALFSKYTPDEYPSKVFSKNFNSNITLSAIGLALISFFEELDPITHGLVFLIIPIIWIILFLSEKYYFNIPGVVFLISLPFIVFLLELLLNETIFTPITEIQYFFASLIVMLLPPMILQVNQFLRKSVAINFNPFVIGSAFYSLVLTVAFVYYDFQPIEARFLVISGFLSCILSVFLIKWQYEYIVLLISSFLPSLTSLDYLMLPLLVSYLIPLFPLVLNFLVSIKYVKTSISVKVHEAVMLVYLIIILILNPMGLIEYSILIAVFFLVGWYIIQLKGLRIDQTTMDLFNLLNSVFILILILFIDFQAPEMFISELGINISQNGLLLSITIIFMVLAILVQLISLQMVRMVPSHLIIIILGVVTNFSSLILLYNAYMIRITEISSENVVLSILFGSVFLLILSMLIFINVKSLKPHLTVAIVFSSAIWLLLSSIYIGGIEYIFLWLFFAPIFMVIFLIRKEDNFALIGIIYYIAAGLVMIEHWLDFLLYGEPDWLAVFALIIYGVELVSLGIYSSLFKRSGDIIITESVE